MEGYYISTQADKMDVTYIHNYLSHESYWAKGRSRAQVERSIASSLCFGLFDGDKQLGFARISTDYVVFAWLMDFFIDPEFRGHGLGKLLLESILDHPDLQEVNGIGLRTEDAHGLYKKYGFGEIPKPETWMFKDNR